MRKRVLPLLAMFLMLVLMPATVAAHTEAAPFKTDMIAGGGSEASAIDVGDILVWNDGDYLYVKYVTDGCWIILETHLQVSESLDGIPQTKKNNPIPGHFEYSSMFDFEDGKTEWLYTIPLEWEYDTDLFIAAHAVVVKISDPVTICDTSQPGIDVYGPSESYYVLDDSAWGSPSPAVAAWVHGSWPLLPDATWISTSEYVEDPVYDSWRKFHSEIELPEKGYYLTGSVVTATSDNAEEVYFNGIMVGSDGEVQGPFEDDYEWATIVDYPVEPVPGMNHLDFIVRNYYQASGTTASNPTGLVYKACFNCYQEETAWGAGTTFNDKNWATYFHYIVQDYICAVVLQPVDGNQIVIAQTLLSDLGGLDLSGQVFIKVTYPIAGGNAYFPTLYIDVNGDEISDYTFEGWCVDTGHVIYQNTWYEVNVYTCGDDLTGVVDMPENKHLVDYILSQDYVGKPSECDGDFTYGDVQRAIWTVIDDTLSTSGLGSWSQCRVDEILTDVGWLSLSP
ncbi:MAG: hypothetical protein ACFFF9_14050 [Candidatus Thorarchaeota archaeon]